MSWSLSLGRLAGIELKVHLTFFLLLAWIGAAMWTSVGPRAAADGVLFVVLLFGCVVLHELGHALAARRYGIGTRDILLLPIGGLASLDRMPDDPRQEVVVALAGPLVNVVIAALLFGLFGAKLVLLDPQSFGSGWQNFLDRLATTNLALAIFNMIPAFPMDGGRVLRALLAFRIPRADATQIAARVGQGLAILFAFLGLLGNPILILIAIFVFFAANAESYSATLHDLARGRPIHDALITEFESLSPDDDLRAAADLLLATTQKEFPVVDAESRLIGFLTRDTLVRELGQHDAGEPLRRFIETTAPVLQRGAPLDSAISALERGGVPAVAVVDDGNRLVGYVTLENLAEFFMLGNARGLAARDRRSRARA